MTKQKQWLLVIVAIVLSITCDILVGFLISNHVRSSESVYRTALKTTNKQRFNYIVKSQQGNVITHAALHGDPVKFREMNKNRKFMAVHRILEVYTMHTRTYTDSKGNVHTETYWTWDDSGSDTVASKKVRIYGHSYPTKRFSLSDYYQDIDADKIVDHGTGLTGMYYYLNSMERYRYEVIPTTISGSFIANASKGTLAPTKGNTIAVSKQSYKDYLRQHQTNGWQIITILMLMLVAIEALAISYMIYLVRDNERMDKLLDKFF